MKYRVAIIKSESSRDHLLWLESCSKLPEIEAIIIDLTENNWLSKIEEVRFDIFLLRPPGQTSLFKQLYDERIWILNKVLEKEVYPSIEEVFIYENKRLLRDWLMAKKLPLPETFVFFNFNEVSTFLSKTNFPLVAKTNIGASGNGVVILNNATEGFNYVKSAFASGVRGKSGPKLFKGSILKKIKKVLNNKNFLKSRLIEYKAGALEVQKNFVIFQEYIQHDFEWRCVVIGESYFAHKKLALNGKTSGTLLKGYDPVPEKLLNFLREVCKTGQLSSVAIDVFEHKGNYVINEIQCFFGQSDQYQMLVDKKPGRYLFQDNSWVFEEGMFNTNECYDLRLQHAMSRIK